jgi:putative transposase
MSNKCKNMQIKETLMNTYKKRANQTCRSYIVKIQDNKLNKKQLNALQMMFVEAKWYYNHIISLTKNSNENIFKLNSSSITSVKHYDKAKNEIVSELAYLKSSMKQAILDIMCSNIKSINTLIKNKHQKHSKYLKYITEFKSIHLKQYGITHKIIDKHHIKLMGIAKPVYVHGLEQIDADNCEYATINILNKPTGFYLSIVTYTDNNKLIKKSKAILNPIGIDFGCQTSITTSEGEKENIAIKETEHLKMIQKSLRRKVKGSNNYYKDRKLLQKEYQRITNRKNDLANKVIAKLLEHEIVIMQDEQISNWKQNKHGKAIQHSILGRVKAKLKKASNVIILSKYIPTTKLCTNCGAINNIELHERTYKCNCSNAIVDRDIHAAQTMLWIYNNLIPMGHRDFKRAEFQTSIKNFSFNAKMDNKLETSKHEATRSLV